MYEKESLPQLSICFYEIISEYKLGLLNKSLKDEYHSLIDDPSKFNKWKNSNFNLKNLFDLSFNYEDYFQNCTFLDKDAIKELNCSTFYKITLSTKKKCFNFFHRTTHDDDDEQWTYNRILLQNRPWVRIFVSKKYLKHKKKMDVIINPHFSIPNTDKSNPGFKSYTTDYTQSIFVSYDCRKSIRLPSPYETDCQNYTKLGYYDRSHCIYECKASNFIYRQGGWTEDLTVNQSFAELVNSLNITFNYTTDLINDCEIDKKKCNHLDCRSKEYRIINKYHKLDVKSISNEIEIRLYLNSAPTSSLEYEALTPLSNSFITLFIGPASLWLGLSIYSLCKLAFWFLCEVTNQKKRKKRKNNEANTKIEKDDLKKETNELKINKLDKNNNKLEFKTDYQTNYKSFNLDNNLIKNDKLIDKSIDNYYNQINQINNSRFNSSSFDDKTNIPIINSLNNLTNNQLNPIIYKAGLELYPKKPLKLKLIKDNNEKSNKIEDNLISKLTKQKNKFINSIFKSKQVYPNLIN